MWRLPAALNLPPRNQTDRPEAAQSAAARAETRTGRNDDLTLSLGFTDQHANISKRKSPILNYTVAEIICHMNSCMI